MKLPDAPWRWRPVARPPNAPPPDYGDFWERYPLPPEGLIAPLSQEAPIEALLYGPPVRAVMGRLVVDEIIPEEGARPSSLVPVHRARYDHAYEMDLMRQLKLANELEVKKYGPRPAYTPPPPPKRKPNLPKRPIPPEYLVKPEGDEPPLTGSASPEIVNPTEQEQEMNLKQMAAAVTLGAAAITATAADKPKHFDPYDLHNFNRHPHRKFMRSL